MSLVKSLVKNRSGGVTVPVAPPKKGLVSEGGDDIVTENSEYILIEDAE